jgi:hypothetical protein
MQVVYRDEVSDMTDIVVEQLGEAMARPGQIFVGTWVGNEIHGRWVDAMSRVGRMAKPFEMSGPKKWECTELGSFVQGVGLFCQYTCTDGSTHPPTLQNVTVPGQQQGPSSRARACPDPEHTAEKLEKGLLR